MYRIDVPSAAVSLPTPSALGTEGFWTAGTPGVTAATILDQDWLNMVQEELVSILTAAGIARSKSTRNQVLTSIQALIAAGSVGAPSVTSDLLIVNDGSSPNTKVNVTATAAVLTNGTAAVLANSISQSIDYTTNGAGGLDTGSLANSTWYHHWLIYNPTTLTLKTLGSLSATSPTLPSGYTYKKRIGAIFTDGSAHFMRVRQSFRKSQYVVTAATNTANMPLLASGTAGAPGTPTWVGLSVANFVPPTAQEIALLLNYSGNDNTIVAPNNAYGALGSTSNPPFQQASIASAPVHSDFFTMLLESSSIFWANSASSAQISVTGWVDAI